MANGVVEERACLRSSLSRLRRILQDFQGFPISRVPSEWSGQAGCPVCLCVPRGNGKELTSWEVTKHMTVTATEGLLGGVKQDRLTKRLQ